MNIISRCLLYCIAVAGLVSFSAHATIVRMDLVAGQQFSGSVYIQLYNSQAPDTVANFLRYIKDDVSGERRYDNTFIHRSMPGFVIQGGGYVFNPGSTDPFGSNASTPHILTYPPVKNEFNRSSPISNLRGTIAMAKKGGDPDSATSEWFFNLADNSANLDNQNGGFTVFGKVLGNGMTVINAVTELAISNQGGAFTNLPVVDLIEGATLAEQNLIRVAGMVVNPPKSISVDIVDQDFDMVPVSISRRVTITLENTGPTDLTINGIGNINPLAAPFSIDPDSNTCLSDSPVVMAFGGTCVFDVVFSPVAEGPVSDSFSIETSDVILPELTIQVRGDGASAAATLEVTPAVLDLGNIGTGEPVQRTISVRNIGGGSLLPGEPVIGGLNAAEVTLDNGCAQQSLAFDQSCNIIMTLTAPSVGDYSATITVNVDADTGSAQSAGVTVAATATLLEPEIIGPDKIDMGDAANGQDNIGALSFGNNGIDTLYVSDIQFIGENSALFSVSSSCIQIAVGVGMKCSQQVTFLPVSAPLGELRSTLRIYSNDPDTPVFDIPVVAVVSVDGDGVPDIVEAAAPNDGDGNQDGIPDNLQNNVASLPDADGNYVAITSPDGTTLRGVSVSSESPAAGGSVPDTPVSGASVTFKKGFFSFAVEGVPVSGTVAVKLYFQTEQPENSYFKYGWLPGERALRVPEHWYLFDFKEDSGTGATFNGNIITLYLTDGGRGDSSQGDDGGRIVDPGGPAVVALTDVGSGGGCTMRRGGTGVNGSDLVLLLAGILLFRVISLSLFPYMEEGKGTWHVK